MMRKRARAVEIVILSVSRFFSNQARFSISTGRHRDRQTGSSAAAYTAAESTDYPFTLLEMRMAKDNKGEGRMLARSAITTKNGRLELENYGNEPIKPSAITEEEKKK
jgi:hypothetical protein